MNTPPYAPPPHAPFAYAAPEKNNLAVLATLHWIYGAFLVFGGLAFCAYIVIGIVIAGAIATAPKAPAFPLGEGLGVIFAVIGGVAAVVVWTKAAFVFWTAKSLASRRRHTMCFVVACVECTAVPLGTALGVFTLIELNKPEVKALFS